MKLIDRKLLHRDSKESSLSTEVNQNERRYAEISRDPEYVELLTEFQQGHWGNCRDLLDHLNIKYSANPLLEEFTRDFEVRYDVVQTVETAARRQAKTTLLKNSKRALIILGIIAVIAGLIMGTYFLITTNLQRQKELRTDSQIETLGTQVDNLLSLGQPEKAKELIQTMKSIDPENPRVIALSAKVEEVLKINSRYIAAQEKLSAGDYQQALDEFNQIEAEYPAYRDVQLLIEQASNQIQIIQSTNDATAAYNENRWQDAINGFENVLMLDPANSDSDLQFMLLNSYLHRIIQMLDNPNTTVDDINQAEIYYQKAIAMIPQSRLYLNERENLQKISSDLLELKYTQSAYSMINDPTQTLATVATAVNYLKKASNLDPNNSVLQSDLNKITLYQAGLQYYLEMNWPSAIDPLANLVSIDENYAGGLAKQLLYEAYVSRGLQYYRVGLYIDARTQFESAETLVFDRQNLMDLFTVEIYLAQSIGKLKDYQDAASYYKYAVEAVNYPQRAMYNSTFLSNLISAIDLYTSGDYEASYTLFESTLQDKSPLYTTETINAHSGQCLAFLAAQYGSSVQSILESNSMTQQTILTTDQQLTIQTMP